jgi:hypothetical protein
MKAIEFALFAVLTLTAACVAEAESRPPQQVAHAAGDASCDTALQFADDFAPGPRFRLPLEAEFILMKDPAAILFEPIPGLQW